MIRPHDSPIVTMLSRLLIPVVQLYAVYVIFNAQYSPGGGFVGGVLFGTSLILSVLVFGTPREKSYIQKLATHADGLGLLLFAVIGTLCIIAGKVFLNYSALAIPGLDTASRHALGIIGTQVGVAMDVSVVSISIFFNLSPQEEEDETVF